MAIEDRTITYSQNAIRKSHGVPLDLVSSISHHKTPQTGHETVVLTNHIQRLPVEILHRILELVIHHTGDVRKSHSGSRYHSVVLVCRDWVDIASNIWWKTRRFLWHSAENPLASLARLPLERQQWYADKIQHLDLEESNATDFIAALDLGFPFLRNLEVSRYCHEPNDSPGFVCLASQFLGRSLLELKLLRHYRTDDILTALLNAPNLRTLDLHCESLDATSEKLLDAIRTCSQLRVLVLNFPIEPLVTKDVFAQIASLPYLTSLCLPRDELTSETSMYVLAANNSPFCSIAHLDLGKFHSTAINLLTGIHTLRSLSLGVIGSAPTLQVLATLCNLQELTLRFHDSTSIGYSEWKHLANLEHLRSIKIASWDYYRFSQVDLSSITTDELVSVFRAMPQLSSFWSNAAISNTAQFYIQAGEVCKSLNKLELRGQFDSTMLLDSHIGDDPLYPMLEYLWVHQFIEPQDEHTW
jgi:hypothetical protein